MSERPENSSPQDWGIPPPGQSGKVPWIVRTAAMGLKSGAIWEARPDHPREKALLMMLHDTCREMGITKIPRLFIYDSDKPNAAAMTLGSYTIFSTSLLDIMPRDQVKAVMGHELTHYSKQKLSINVISWTVNIITGAAIVYMFRKLDRLRPQQTLTRWLRSISQDYLIRDYLAQIANFSLFQSIFGWFSRRFEMKADLGGAKVAGSDAMIDALETLDKRSKEIQMENVRRGRINWRKYTVDLPIFASHPSTEKRIRNILAHEPKSFTERKEQDKSQSTATDQSPAK